MNTQNWGNERTQMFENWAVSQGDKIWAESSGNRNKVRISFVNGVIELKRGVENLSVVYSGIKLFSRTCDDNVWTCQTGNNRRLEKIHEEELYNFSSSPSSIRVIKSRRMKRAEEKFMHFLISNFRRVLYVVCFLLG